MNHKPHDNFIADYCYYHSGLECPTRYFVWSALAFISIVISRRVYLDRVYDGLRLTPQLYVCLVGVQGGRKSVAKDACRDILINEFPDIPIGGSVETPQSITKFMASDDGMRAFIDETGANVEYRPYCLIVNELKNFLSLNAVAMIDFLVDIWDRKFYLYRTANKGEHHIVNPYVSFLGCGTTDFITDYLKEKILSGGLARRMLFINYNEEVEYKTPYIPEGSLPLIDRAKKHLHRLRGLSGPFRWEPGAYATFETWRIAKKPTHSDPVMAGFMRTKADLVLKVMMLLCLAEYETTLLLRNDHLALALEMFADIEPDMERLFAGAGKNPLATPTAQALQLIEMAGGRLSMVEFRKVLFRDMPGRDIYGVIEHLRKTDQLFVVADENKREYVLTKQHKEKLQAQGLVKKEETK